MAKAPVDRLLPNRQTKSGSSSQSHKWKCKRRRWPSNPKAVRSIAPLPDRSTRPGSSSQRHIMSRASARRHQTGCTSRACRKSRIKNRASLDQSLVRERRVCCFWPKAPYQLSLQARTSQAARRPGTQTRVHGLWELSQIRVAPQCRVCQGAGIFHVAHVPKGKGKSTIIKEEHTCETCAQPVAACIGPKERRKSVSSVSYDTP